MATIREVAEFFLISLSFGVGIFTCFINTEQSGGGIMKVMSGVCGISAFLAFALHLLSGTYPLAIIIGFAGLIGSDLLIYLLHKDTRTLATWLFYFTHSIFGIALIYLLSQSFLSFVFLLSSSLFLGVVTFAMLKGHWYLVTPKLSELPLLKSVIVIWCLLSLKVLFTGYGYLAAQGFFTQFSQLGEGYVFNWIIFSMRLIWGYLIILIMSIFAWKLVRMRSIQSATGIFYAMVIFVFIGELISGYLFFKHGLFL